MWENWIITKIFCWDGHILRSNYPLVGSEWAWKLQMEITWLRDSCFSQSDIPISCNISLMGSVNLLWIIPPLPPTDDIVDIFINVHLFTPLGMLEIVTKIHYGKVREKLTPQPKVAWPASSTLGKVAFWNVDKMLGTNCLRSYSLHWTGKASGYLMNSEIHRSACYEMSR